MYDFRYKKPTKVGGKLKVSHLKGLLNASYEPKDEVDGFILDKKLSSKTSKVYFDPKTNQSVVAHRGTSGFTDWINNAVFAYGGKKAYEMTPRYRQAKEVQQKAQDKYGKDNITTIGHSQGGLQAELLGGNSKEVITLNKATRPFSNKKNENQFDIRAESDVVSGLNPVQIKNGNEIIIPSKNLGALDAHKIEILEQLEGDREIGKGISRGNGLTDLQIKHLLHGCKIFAGCYMKNELPDILKSDMWYIMNMDNAPNSGTHWICFKTCSPFIYFDPLIGGDPPLEVLEKARKFGIYYDMKEIQNVNSTGCGWFCVGCILHDSKSKDNSYKSFKKFTHMFSNNNNINDRILGHMLKQLI